VGFKNSDIIITGDDVKEIEHFKKEYKEVEV
jgi:hypothetical protein